MKKLIAIGLMAALIGASQAPAASRHVRSQASNSSSDDSSYSNSSSASDPNSMAGKFGFGAEYLPGPALIGNIGDIVGTYWPIDKLAIDAGLGYTGGTYYSGSTDSSGNPTTSSNSGYAISAGARFDLAQPNQYLALQAIGRLSYVNGQAVTSVLGKNTTAASSYVDLFLGAGFEGFIPAWNDIALELNTGLSIVPDNTTITTPAGGVNVSGMQFALGTNYEFLPWHVSLHYYFR